MRHRIELAAAVLALLLAHSALAGLPAEELFVLDADQDLGTGPGVLARVDLLAGTSDSPVVETDGPPMGFPVRLALSPFDGRLYIADIDVDGADTGGILRVTGGQGVAVTLPLTGLPLADPTGIAFLPDGRLVVADQAADPSGLGEDRSSDAIGGPGALFLVDPSTNAVTLLSDGRLHEAMPGVPAGASAFEEPWDVVYSPVTRTLYVADGFADPLGLGGYRGAVLAVDAATGFVRTVAADRDFLGPSDLAVTRDGSLMVLDLQVLGGSTVWRVDVRDGDVRNNHELVTTGEQYGAPIDIAIDGAGRLFLLDIGVYDVPNDRWIDRPGVYRVDSGSADPETNGVLVNDSGDFLSPISLEQVPRFQLDAIVPARVPPRPAACAAVPLQLEVRGSGLFPGLDLAFTPRLTIASEAFGDSSWSGDRLLLEVLPTPGADGTFDLGADWPFDGSDVLSRALTLDPGFSSEVPLPPCSRRGDANCDGVVDGIDLGILGRSFGAEFCTPPRFVNDADFTDDDVIDGADLAILAAFFGTRP
jgi:sugar lactone lactonase YvrE